MDTGVCRSHGGYPAFNATHVYTVVMDIVAGPAEQLTFGSADCGCFDNVRTFDVSLRGLP